MSILPALPIDQDLKIKTLDIIGITSVSRDGKEDDIERSLSRK